MPLESLPPDEPLPLYKAFRHFVVFQIKLLCDAARDLMFSPVSLIAFVIDAITQPTVRESLSYKLMHFGRRSDRVINLFDEFTESGEFTVDIPVKGAETALHRALEKRKK